MSLRLMCSQSSKVGAKSILISYYYIPIIVYQQ